MTNNAKGQFDKVLSRVKFNSKKASRVMKTYSNITDLNAKKNDYTMSIGTYIVACFKDNKDVENSFLQELYNKYEKVVLEISELEDKLKQLKSSKYTAIENAPEKKVKTKKDSKKYNLEILDTDTEENIYDLVEDEENKQKDKD